jgi:uncharacterized Tic20 family protein
MVRFANFVWDVWGLSTELVDDRSKQMLSFVLSSLKIAIIVRACIVFAAVLLAKIFHIFNDI